MSSYDKRTFFWLQLRENFFDEDCISWLEEQPNGKEYCLFYLKLCLKSLKTNGILIRQVGELLVPYDMQKLAEITKTEKDVVKKALKKLKEINLVKVLDNGELYLSDIENMIGEKSIGAFKKEQQRRLKKDEKNQGWTKGGQKVDKGVDKCPPDIDIELDIDIDKEREYRERKNPTLEEVQKFAEERKSIIDAQKFFDYYDKGSWLDSQGKPVLNWKQRFISWENKEQHKSSQDKKQIELSDKEKEFYGGTRNGDF